MHVPIVQSRNNNIYTHKSNLTMVGHVRKSLCSLYFIYFLQNSLVLVGFLSVLSTVTDRYYQKSWHWIIIYGGFANSFFSLYSTVIMLFWFLDHKISSAHNWMSRKEFLYYPLPQLCHLSHGNIATITSNSTNFTSLRWKVKSFISVRAMCITGHSCKCILHCLSD